MYKPNNQLTPLTKKHLSLLENSMKKAAMEDTIDSLLDGKPSTKASVFDMNPPSSTASIDYLSLRHHVSYSEIATWMDCHYKHKLKYLDGIKVDKDGPSEHTEFGQVIHDALEKYLTTRIMPPIDEVKAELTKMFSALPNASELKESEWHDTIEPILSEVPAFMDESFGSDWEFVAAEYPLMESIDGHGHMFKGFIDGVIKYTNKRGVKQYFYLDWKSCSYFWPMAKRIDPKKTMQLAFYKYFYSRKYEIPLKDSQCGFILLRRSKKPGNCELVKVSVGDKAVEKALGTIDTMLGHIRLKMFPKDRDSCKFCPYAGTEHCK